MVGSRRLYDGKSLHLALSRWNNPAGDLLMPWLQRYLRISVRRERRLHKWRITVPLRRYQVGREPLLLRLTIYARKAPGAARGPGASGASRRRLRRAPTSSATSRAGRADSRARRTMRAR